ncbi:hypothetical protein WJX81_000395 [Elliptochloris bilobata]|uniref:CHRD domain-containing protein n=1 Tax=Elliptochloris bilobata TaxID=381761 RepID=A0AAW1RNL2_9CHLO
MFGALSRTSPRTAAFTAARRVTAAAGAAAPRRHGPRPARHAAIRPAAVGRRRQRVGVLTLTRDRMGKLFFNTTFTSDVGAGNPVQSVLISVPPFINSSAVTLAVLYMNATQQAEAPVVANVNANSTSWSLTGPAAPVPGVAVSELLANLSLGRAVVNIYTANFPQPLQPMGCCNNAEVRSEGSVEPLNSAALPAGGLRQDHHGFERVPLQPADSLPYHAYLEAADPTVNTTAQGLIQLQIAPDNSSVVYNVTLGSLAPTNEIYNVSIWFGNGKTRRLGWFPYSLYSFASDRLPTPLGGLLPPTNGANFTLATGWIGRWVDTVSRATVNDPTYEYGIQQLVAGNVYVIIGTARYPQGELSGHAVLGWGAAPS